MNEEHARGWSERIAAAILPGGSEYDLPPMVLEGSSPSVSPGDVLVMACRRGEREVQITRAFADPRFDEFPRPDLGDMETVTLTLYHDDLSYIPRVLEPLRVAETLGEIVSGAGLTQVRIAESEKFAHITRFLNGGRAEPFEGERRIQVPSP